MRKVLLYFGFFVLMGSCSEGVTIQENEALHQEVFKSVEFQALKNSYNDFHHFKMNEMQKIINNRNSGKVSHDQYIENRETYLQKCADMMKIVAEKNQIIFDKFPKLKETTEISEFLKQLQDEFMDN